MERINAIDVAKCQLIRRRSILDLLDPKGIFKYEHSRNGKIIRSGIAPNVVTVQGKNFMLNATFQGLATTEHLIWYMGLIDQAVGWTAVDEDDIYDNINEAGNAWDEFQDYTYAASSVNRGTWDVGGASAKQVTSDTQTQFDIVAPGGTIKGAFICAGAVGEAKLKGNHIVGAPPNILFSASVLSGGDVVVADNDTFKMTYTITT